MAYELDVLDNNMVAKGKMGLSFNPFDEEVKVPVVHQVVKSILASRRQGNACTKTKAHVSGGGKKPFKQKGTGRARQGSTRSPIMPGGGTVFGPSTRSFEQKVNKKVVKVAVRSVLIDKIKSGKIHVLNELPAFTKTKEVHALLSSKGLENALIVSSDVNAPILMSSRNLRKVKALPVSGFSVYEAVRYENLIIEKEALNTLLKRVETI